MSQPAVPRVAEQNPIPATWATDLEPAAAGTLQQLPAEAAPASEDPFAGVKELDFAAWVDVPEDRRRGIKAYKACSCCGAQMVEGQQGHAAVARVVRVNQRYGSAPPGSLVWIEPKDLHGAALEATMSLGDYRAMSAAAKVPQAPKEKPLLVQMVEAGLEAAAAQTRSLIERGKVRAAAEQEAAAREAAALRGPAPATDLENASQPTRPVEGA